MNYALLQRIWERSEPGFVFLPERNATTGEWIEHDAYSSDYEFGPNPDGPGEGAPFDLYFTPVTYTKPERRTENLAMMGVLYADLDDKYDGDMLNRYPPTILTETSPHRFQGVWFLDTPQPHQRALDLNHRLSRLLKADHGSWIPTKVLRVPGSVNYKRGGNIVRTYATFETVYAADRLWEELPPLPELTIRQGVSMPPLATRDETRRLIQKVWNKLDHRTKKNLALSWVPDRSLHLAQLATQLHKLGLQPAEIFQILYRLPTNKFANRPEVLWKSVVLTAVQS